MELSQNLGLKLLENQEEQEKIILDTTNTFFLLLKIPKIL